MAYQNIPITDSPNQAHHNRITESMLLSLRQTKPWVRLLSVFGFISIGFIVISGLINIFVLPNVQSENSFISVFSLSVVNLLIGFMYFFPSLFLFKYASSIGRLLDGGGSSELEEALYLQKRFWRFVGILTLVSFVLALVGISAAIIIPFATNGAA